MWAYVQSSRDLPTSQSSGNLTQYLFLSLGQARHALVVGLNHGIVIYSVRANFGPRRDRLDRRNDALKDSLLLTTPDAPA